MKPGDDRPRDSIAARRHASIASAAGWHDVAVQDDFGRSALPACAAGDAVMSDEKAQDWAGHRPVRRVQGHAGAETGPRGSGGAEASETISRLTREFDQMMRGRGARRSEGRITNRPLGFELLSGRTDLPVARANVDKSWARVNQSDWRRNERGATSGIITL